MRKKNCHTNIISCLDRYLYGIITVKNRKRHAIRALKRKDSNTNESSNVNQNSYSKQGNLSKFNILTFNKQINNNLILASSNTEKVFQRCSIKSDLKSFTQFAEKHLCLSHF